MRLELTGRHVTITPTTRRLVEQQLAHVLRMLNDSAVSGQVVLTKEKSRVHCDATIHARGEKFLHGEANGRDVESALASAIDKIDRQAQKIKSKWTERKRRGISAAKAASAAPRPERGGKGFGERRQEADVTIAAATSAIAGGDEAVEVRIIRARRYPVKPMTIDEAAMEVVDRDASFLVFRNAANDEVTVLFRRPDGNLGLIEP
jgi:putative sigma-54 modulation protein